MPRRTRLTGQQGGRFESQAIEPGLWSIQVRDMAREWRVKEAQAALARDYLEVALFEASELGAPLSQLQGELAAVGLSMSRNAIHGIVGKHRARLQ